MGPETVKDGIETFLAPGRTLLPNPDRPEGQIKIVRNDQHGRGGYLPVLGERDDHIARSIHEGMRFRDPHIEYARQSNASLLAVASWRSTPGFLTSFYEPVHREKSDIVPRPGIALPRISEADDKPNRFPLHR